MITHSTLVASNLPKSLVAWQWPTNNVEVHVQCVYNLQYTGYQQTFVLMLTVYYGHP